MTLHSFHRSLAGIVITISIAAPVRAADPARDTPPDTVAPLVSATRSPQADIEDDEPVLDPAEPDVVVVNLPTTMRFPARGINFRLTHRFVGDLRRGSFGENAANLFGLDQGAIIGLEFRMGLTRNLQAAAFRTNFDRTIQLYGKYDAIRQGEGAPVGISAIVSVEGTDNFQEDYAPAVGAVVSHKVGSYLAMYAMPMWIGNTSDDQHTVMLGVGGRVRVRPSVYVVGEVVPRLDGYAPGELMYGFGIEKRVGGHAFSLTFTNGFSTTYAQLARGGSPGSLYMGFNLSRRFF